jgi:UDP-N-acetylglucosamine 1-carboxyvinyltransferase
VSAGRATVLGEPGGPTVVAPFGTLVAVDRFLLRPAGPLRGEVLIGGAKNSVLKLMAACLLAEGPSRLAAVPDIADVTVMSEVLTSIGARVERHDGTVTVDTPAEIIPVAPYELVEKMRASVVVLGPLLGRHGRARVSLPGGDDFGSRPIDIHLKALEELGAHFSTEHGYVEGRCDGLVGARIVLEYPSHTATDNVLMAAVLAKGTTIIENAAREPEIEDLATFLRAMGAQIRGDGTSRIEVEGVTHLRPATHTAIADRVEAATFLAAVGLASGEVRLRGAYAGHMDMLFEKLVAMGMTLEVEATGVLARSDGRLSSVDAATLPYPGVATDYKPLLVSMLTVASGVAVVTENLFAGRFRYVDELRRMGADIHTEGHHAIVRGVDRLSGARVRAPDIRAGAALVVAGLVAEGETEITGVEHVDRGYERFEVKLAGIGADIVRVSQPPKEG